MATLTPTTTNNGTIVIGYMFLCPGCDEVHIIYTNRDWCNEQPSGRPCWGFNGDVNRPTFSPSLLCQGLMYPSGNKFPNEEEINRMRAGENLRPLMKPYVCHSFIRDGKIEFLNDCTHKLKGQTVDLPDVQENQK
jgi:hypothetical protein